MPPGLREYQIPTRLTLFCVALSLLLHGGLLAWYAGARAGGEASATLTASPDAERPEQDQTRLGIESAEHATINWLGFADPTPHRATESETDQAALSLSPLGSPEPPSSPAPQSPEPPTEPAPPQQTPEQQDADTQPTRQPPSEAQTEPTPPGAIDATEAAQKTEDAQAPVVVRAKDDKDETPSSETPAPEVTKGTPPPQDPPQPPTTEQAEAQPKTNTESQPKPDSQPASSPAPQADRTGADAIPGIIGDRESTPTSKTVNLDIKDWGKPAAGKGIRVNPIRPVFPSTIAVFNRQLDAVVLIDFGPDGRVRNVEFEKIVDPKGKTIIRHTGSPEADRVLINSVYNWTARGDEIDALKTRGPDARMKIRMQMRIRP